MIDRYKKPDKKNSISIVEAAERDMKYTLSLPLSHEGGAIIIRNIYESFRMLGDALLVSKGFKSEDHITQIGELIKLEVDTARPLSLINNLRVLRHMINYYGYAPEIEEVKDVILFAKNCFEPIAKAVRKKIIWKTYWFIHLELILLRIN